MSLRIGLVGCGRWGRNILRDLLRLDCRVHVLDVDDAACRLALENGAATAHTDLAGFRDELDGYVVATPTVVHFESVSALLTRGRPIFCEKPLTPDSVSARALAAQDNGLVFQMDKWRYHPGIEALAELARDGALGAVQQLRTRRLQWGQPHTDVDGVWVLLPHDVSIVEHILGYLPPAVAAAADYSGDRMDGMLAILGDGPTAVIEVSSRQPVTGRQVSVSFERGAAWLADPLDDHIRIYRHPPGTAVNPGNYEVAGISTEWPLYLELKHFTEFLAGGPPPLTNSASAAAHVTLIERLRELSRGT